MPYTYKRFNIAPGHDNKEELAPLWHWSDCYFQTYKINITIKFFEDEGQEADGTRRLKPIGLPHVVIMLENLYIEEWMILRDDILDGSHLDGPVTTHVPFFSQNVWRTCNGLMQVRPQMAEQFNGAEYRDFEFDIWDLVVI